MEECIMYDGFDLEKLIARCVTDEAKEQKTIDKLKTAQVNPELKLGGIIMTMYDGRTRLSYEVWQEVNKFYANSVFRTAIPRNSRLSEAPSFGQTVFEYAPESTGSLAYRAFAREFAGRFLTSN
ncbi:MAG: ParA family protein [Opitutae bacterium]|nr:ParA family protein [Opitutae bacterium]